MQQNILLYKFKFNLLTYHCSFPWKGTFAWKSMKFRSTNLNSPQNHIKLNIYNKHDHYMEESDLRTYRFTSCIVKGRPLQESLRHRCQNSRCSFLSSAGCRPARLAPRKSFSVSKKGAVNTIILSIALLKIGFSPHPPRFHDPAPRPTQATAIYEFGV